MKRKFDIIVVGAGINGKVMSLAAAHQGFSVGLIDQKKIVEDTLQKFDGRAYAIAFSSVQMLKNLDLWDKISETAQPVLNIKVSHGTLEGGPFSSNITFKNADIEESPMAQMVEDRYLRQCLSSEIKKNNLVEVIDQKQVGQIIDYKAKKVISGFTSKFADIDKISKETLEPIVNELIKSNETNFKGIGQPLRIALTGSKFGPGIYDIIITLGKEEVTKRLTSKKLS